MKNSLVALYLSFLSAYSYFHRAHELRHIMHVITKYSNHRRELVPIFFDDFGLPMMYSMYVFCDNPFVMPFLFFSISLSLVLIQFLIYTDPYKAHNIMNLSEVHKNIFAF